jgi:hypothetical protein
VGFAHLDGHACLGEEKGGRRRGTSGKWSPSLISGPSTQNLANKASRKPIESLTCGTDLSSMAQLWQAVAQNRVGSSDVANTPMRRNFPVVSHLRGRELTPTL